MEPIRLPDHVWDCTEMQAACRARDAGQVLRVANRRGRISQARLGFHLGGLDSTEVGKIIRGSGDFTAAERWERLASALNIPMRARDAPMPKPVLAVRERDGAPSGGARLL